MTRFKKFGALFFISAYLFIGGAIVAPKVSLAALDPVKFTPQISIPGSEFQQGVSTTIGTATDTENLITGQMERVMRSDLLARYIAAFYNWGLYIVGALAVLMLMAAGLIWLTSMGDPGKIGQAKKMIGGSIMGTALLVGAWFFLNTINPDLTKLPSIDAIIIIPPVYGCCALPGKAEMSSQTDCTAKSGVFSADTMADPASNTCKKMTCCFHDSTNSADGNEKICIDEIPGKCDGFEYAGLCSTVPECKNITANCAGIVNGERCNNPGGNTTLNAMCYYGRCYYGSATLGEYCGNNNDTGGVCVKSTDGCTETDLGGRECVGGNNGNLKCCAKKIVFEDQCRMVANGTSCKLTVGSANGDGYCSKGTCVKCIDPFRMFSTGFAQQCTDDYQCGDNNRMCGDKFTSGSCVGVGAGVHFCGGTIVKKSGDSCDKTAIGDNCLSAYCCGELCCLYNSTGMDDTCVIGLQRGSAAVGKTGQAGPNSCSGGSLK
jgi:hypothetical protein